MGLEMAVAICIGYGLGFYGDKRWGTGPWLMMVGLLIGIAAGFRSLIRIAQVELRRQKKEAREASQGRGADGANPEAGEKG